MSKSLNSPTARLLQSSRLFSLPRPLPQPVLETPSSTGQYRASDSATLPYPTYQAITTPASSHFRGDWGLKRPLPNRSTKSSTPHIRIKAHDNFAHITDFESAADHTQTEAKWRQMGIPLVVREQRNTYSDTNRTFYSVYDDHVDNTDPDVMAIRARLNAQTGSQSASRKKDVDSVDWKRWKFDSPWLAGMQPGEFNIYVKSRLEPRRAEFRDFMIKRLLHRRVQDEERRLRDLGQRRTLSPSRRDAILQDIIANYETEEKRLRDDHTSLASELSAAICEFLDLPGIRESARQPIQTATSGLANSLLSITSETAEPPSTHPGAGLSHLRSNAVMENHPFWGPQAHASPVLARVVRPRTNATVKDTQAKLGVGGVVAADPSHNSWNQSPRSRQPEAENDQEHYLDADRMTEMIEVDLAGGNKVWVHPQTATINDKGHIYLRVGRGEKEAIAVARDDVEAILQAKNAATQATSTPSAPRGTKGNANYGYSLPDTRYAPRSRVQGFDNELARGPREGRSDGEQSALDKITDMAKGFSRK